MVAVKTNARIRALLDGITDRPSDGTIVAERIPTRRWARIGWDAAHVVLLLPSISGNVRPKNVELDKLSVRFNVACEIHDPVGRQTEFAVVIRLSDSRPSVLSVFIDVLALILDRMPLYEPSGLDDVVQSLIDLFRPSSDTSLEAVIGLYGELLVIDQAVDVDVVASSWHAGPGDLYDFSHRAARLEVKATVGPRRHFFSYEQLRPVVGLNVFIASSVLELSPDGELVTELLARVIGRIQDNATAHRVIRLSTRILGSLFSPAHTSSSTVGPSGSSARFDYLSATRNLRFFCQSEVPCIEAPPLGVSEVRFRVDLQLASSSSRRALHSNGQLAKAAVR